MKTRWWMTAVATTLLALMSTAVLAQDRGQNRDDRNRQGHTTFDDHDRQVARDWYIAAPEPSPDWVSETETDYLPNTSPVYSQGPCSIQNCGGMCIRSPLTFRTVCLLLHATTVTWLSEGHIGLVDQQHNIIRDVIRLFDH